jgi:ABC-type lipoprotein release transport system permease subunit
MNKINFYLLEYAYGYIVRHKNKNIFIVTVFTLLVALLCTLFFITTSVSFELQKRIANEPDIVVQNYQAGMPTASTNAMLDKLLEIDGISGGNLRVAGKYYFRKENTYFNLVGIDPFEELSNKFLQNIVDTTDINSSCMLVSKDVLSIMKKAYYSNYFNFVKADGTLVKVPIAGSFSTEDKHYLDKTILMPKELLRKIFAYKSNEGSDIALRIANKNELDFLTTKIRLLFPNAKVISKDDSVLLYKNLFNYDSGVFLALFTIALFTFFIIIYDKANGLSSEEKREIGILKAIGWRVEDVLHAKFYEAALIAFFSFIMGFILAYIFVFILKAPFLGNIFMHENLLNIATFSLNVHIEFSYVLLIFLLSVPLYIAATLIPSWRVATMDADEVMR